MIIYADDYLQGHTKNPFEIDIYLICLLLLCVKMKEQVYEIGITIFYTI